MSNAKKKRQNFAEENLIFKVQMGKIIIKILTTIKKSESEEELTYSLIPKGLTAQMFTVQNFMTKISPTERKTADILSTNSSKIKRPTVKNLMTKSLTVNKLTA